MNKLCERVKYTVYLSIFFFFTFFFVPIYSYYNKYYEQKSFYLPIVFTNISSL